MLLYHGSNLAVDEPQLVTQTRGLDFGAGFYLTTNENQAKRFSEIVTKRRSSGIATVSKYEFDMDTANNTLSILRFAKADAQWLHFVVDNRLKTYTGENYDAVIGAVANDTVMPTIQALLGGFISEAAALLTLKASKLNDQLCLKSVNALALLKFIASNQETGDDSEQQ